MKTQEIRQMNTQERKQLIEETRDKIRALRFDVSIRKMKNHREIRKAKRLLAQMLTIDHQLK